MSQPSTITIDGKTYEVIRDYPLQRAWCYQMVSSPRWSEAQRERMRIAGAAQTAIYDNPSEGTIALMSDDTHPDTRARTVETAVQRGYMIPMGENA